MKLMNIRIRLRNHRPYPGQPADHSYVLLSEFRTVYDRNFACGGNLYLLRNAFSSPRPRATTVCTSPTETGLQTKINFRLKLNFPRRWGSAPRYLQGITAGGYMRLKALREAFGWHVSSGCSNYRGCGLTICVSITISLGRQEEPCRITNGTVGTSSLGSFPVSLPHIPDT